MAKSAKKTDPITPVERRELASHLLRLAHYLRSDSPDMKVVQDELASHLEELKTWPAEDS